LFKSKNANTDLKGLTANYKLFLHETQPRQDNNDQKYEELTSIFSLSCFAFLQNKQTDSKQFVPA